MRALDVRDDLGNAALHEALRSRDHDRCLELLDGGANCHMRDLYGRTPLQIAIENKDLALAQRLVEKGANVNERNCNHLSPLWTAARLGDLPLVKWLCERGADVNLGQHENWSVLHEAAASGSLEVVRYLVEERQVELGGHCPDGSPFMYAVQSANMDLVRYFVQRLQADANEKRPFNLETPLHYAAETGRLELVRYLVEECGARSEPSGYAQRKPIDLAIECGHANVADYLAAVHGHGVPSKVPYLPLPTKLLDRSDDVSVHASASPAESRSASYGATSTGAERAWLREHRSAGATTLPERISAGAHRLESGERLPDDASDCSVQVSVSTLNDAVLSSDLARAQALLDAGIDVNACDDTGSPPLLLAAERNDEPMVQALLLRGALSDIRDPRSGKTLLHICAEMRHFGVLRRLLAAGASPLFQSQDGTLALHAIAEAGSPDLLDALITRHGIPADLEGRPNDYAISHAVWNRQADCVEPLLLRGEPKNPSGSYQKTILQYERWLLDLAVQRGWPQLARTLVAYDARLNTPGSLMLRAARQSRFAHVRIMLDATNLSIDLPDEWGRTLLHHAVDLGDSGFVRELAQRGASFAIGVRGAGARPLEWAVIRNRTELLPFLIEATEDINYETKSGLRFIHYLVSRTDTINLIQMAVQKGADPEARTADGSTLLHLAACKHTPVAVVRYLVEELRLSPNEPNHAGMTPLSYAMERHFFDLVEALIDIEKSVSIPFDPSKYVRTLFCAIEGCHWEAFFKMLLGIRLDESSDLVREARDAQQATFLHHAARQGNLAAVQRLVGLSADVNARADFEKTVLLDGAESGCLDVVRFLVEHGADVQARNQLGKTILHLAAFYPERYDETILAYLVRCGLDVDAKTLKQDTALHFAIENRNLRLIRFLISQEAYLGLKGSSGETPLLFAAKRNEGEIVRLLVEAGCDVQEQNSTQRTALHFAASHGAYDLVQFLVEHGADVNAQDQAGTSVLHWAVKDASEATVRMLLDHGADPLARDKRGQTPWSLSSTRPWHDRLEEMFAESLRRNPAQTVFRLLDAERIPVEVRRAVESAGVGLDIRNDDGCPLLLYLLRRNRRDAVRYLLERGAAPDECDRYGETPLHAAARRGDGETLRLLVQRGAEVHVRDRFGTTVLHDATRSGSIDLVRYLVETCQLDIRARDARGRNVCLAPAEKQHWDILRYLFEKGADIAGVGDFGRTVLHFAALWQKREVFEWLVQRGADTGAKDHYGKTPSDYFRGPAD